jgi:hypothetical protein
MRVCSPSLRPTASKVLDLVKAARGVTRAMGERAAGVSKMDQILAAV